MFEYADKYDAIEFPFGDIEEPVEEDEEQEAL